jgi:hypothetical protein
VPVRVDSERSYDPVRLPLLRRPLKHGQRVCFGIKHPFIEGDKILVREQEIEVFERFGQKVTSGGR